MPLQIPDMTIASQVPDGMTSLGSMLDMRAKQQNLQIGKQTLQSNDMKLQGQDQANQERIGLQGFMQNPDNWQTNGKVDMGKLNAAVPKIAPMTGADVLGKFSELSNSQTVASQSSQNLNQSQRGIVASTLGVLGRMGVTDPQVYHQELDNLNTQFPGNKDMGALIGAYKTQLSFAGKGPQLAKGAITASQALLSPEQQQSALSPSAELINTGGALVPVVKTPSVGGNAPSIAPSSGAPIANTLPPGQQESIANDALGNPSVVKRNPAGAITSTGPVPGAPGGGGFQSMPPGETGDTLKLVQGMRTNANQASAAAPDHQFNTNQIIKYAGESDTGKGASLLANIKGGYAALPWTSDIATNLNLLGHSLAQQQATIAQSAGLNGTNASRDLAKELTSDQEWTAPAIQSASRVMRAIGSTGAQLYNSGMEKAVTSGGPFAARTFQNNWAQAANVDGLRLYDAMKNKDSDPQGLTQVVNSLGGKNSMRLNFALKKIDQMNAVIKGAQ